MDLMIRKLRNDLINIINGAPVPMEAKRLVLIEILAKVTECADAEVEKELNEMNESEEK